MKTKEKLARALEEVHAPALMVTRARQGYYDDFKTSLAFPILQLIEDAENAGLLEIAQRAKDGEFDATKAEGDAWMLTAEGQAILNELRGGSDEDSKSQGSS